jgi:pimeloyl-ACP methyl ester carboxylesterase
MPKVKLPSGVDLYYESHGQGEPLILVPSTAYSGDVWKPSQMPLANTLNLIFFDPRGCGRSIPIQEVFTIEQMAMDIVALMDHLKISSAHLLGGWQDSIVNDTELSRSGEKPDHGGERFGSGGAAGG